MRLKLAGLDPGLAQRKGSSYFNWVCKHYEQNHSGCNQVCLCSLLLAVSDSNLSQSIACFAGYWLCVSDVWIGNWMISQMIRFCCLGKWGKIERTVLALWFLGKLAGVLSYPRASATTFFITHSQLNRFHHLRCKIKSSSSLEIIWAKNYKHKINLLIFVFLAEICQHFAFSN